MPSQIIFLGTAADSFVLSKSNRSAGGIFIQYEESRIFLNPGPGALFQAKQLVIDIQKITALIVTDNTLFHAHDANALIDAMTLGGFDSNGILIAAKSALHGTEYAPSIISPVYQQYMQRTIAMQAWDKIECQTIQIHALPIKNSDPYAIGIKLITPAFSLGYTAKTKYTAKLREEFQDVEILILELPLLYASKKEEGLSLEEAEQLIGEVKPQVAILTGFGMEVVKQDLLELTRTMYKKTNIQTIAAHEGFSFDPTSYAVQLRQKRLQF